MTAPTTRLRVVQVSLHLDAERRGAESLLRAWPTLPSVAAAAASAGLDVRVVQAAHTTETIERDGVTYHFVDAAEGMFSRVIECVAALAPDVVHVQGFGFPRHMRPLIRAARGVPVMVQDHGSIVPAGWRRLAWTWAYRGTAGVAFTARDQAIPWKRAGILRAGLPVFEVLEGSSHFTPGDRAAARVATGMSGEPCLLWTARLDANKDPLTMLAAVEQAAAALPGVRLWCCFGDAPMLAAVQARVAASPTLAARVVLLGARPHAELELRYRAADFFVQTSHREGSGYSLIEALACGVTPLVTDIPSFRRITGDTGSRTPVGDAPALGAAIVAWAARDRAALRRAARARFDAHLAFGTIGSQLRTAYEALVEAPARTSARARRANAAGGRLPAIEGTR